MKLECQLGPEQLRDFNNSAQTPLDLMIAQEQDARAFGFDWEDYHMVINSVIDECRETLEALTHQESPARIQEEIGDVIFAAISLCAFLKFDVNDTITKCNDKFGKRMAMVKQLAQQQGWNNLNEQSLEVKLNLWQQAKKLTDF